MLTSHRLITGGCLNNLRRDSDDDMYLGNSCVSAPNPIDDRRGSGTTVWGAVTFLQPRQYTRAPPWDSIAAAFATLSSLFDFSNNVGLDRWRTGYRTPIVIPVHKPITTNYIPSIYIH
ncbi:hypothetical protein SCLCIDRAFT_686113 [Scleroderma citrinum Foug A]|uniref:Uncharacterized protein n=1 Tax=Scleroderma citrinum Foug A TaxID=1036808 RepID=A0A0C3CR65_9AGAM|nr:hypothetical protein SCLCIDRAFT_686113 [Scleroderma citrinum Foug A]